MFKLSDLINLGGTIFSAYSAVWDWLFSEIVFLDTAVGFTGGVYDWPYVGDLVVFFSEFWLTTFSLDDVAVRIAFRPIEALTISVVVIVGAKITKWALSAFT